MASVLIVEDNVSMCELLCMRVEEMGHFAAAAHDPLSARRLFDQTAIDAVLLDYKFPDANGMALLRELKGNDPSLPIIMITGVGDSTLAIEAMKAGAYDFIRKPLDDVELEVTLGNALRAKRLSLKVAVAASAQDYAPEAGGIIGQSRAMLAVSKAIGRAAASDAGVLITGESGTGKEVVARALHHHSGRSGLFIPINCSAIVPALMESELFGHEKGSFTGAVARKQGKFELADEGTLFFDEIGEAPPSLQTKLLRVLQERSFERVGGNKALRTSARIVAATNRDPREMVERGAFREDLYYRLNIIAIHLPPLRERMEDLPLLVTHLLGKISRRLHKQLSGVAGDAWKLLQNHVWPGNVRELENTLTRAAVLAPGDTITADLLSIIHMDGGGETPAAGEQGRGGEVELISLAELEGRQIRTVLSHTRWHKGKACEILGISRPVLERKISKYGIR